MEMRREGLTFATDFWDNLVIAQSLCPKLFKLETRSNWWHIFSEVLPSS